MADTAVFHHRYKNYGGGERVAGTLADVLEADLFTLWISDDCQDKTDATPLMQDKYSGFVGRKRRSVKAESLCRPIDIEHVDLSEYDTVITSGDMAHCYQPTRDQRHIHYLHTPNRDYFVPDEYRALTTGKLGFVKSLLMQWQRSVDLSHTNHVDHWLCNSELSAARGESVYNLADSEYTVCPPPIAWKQYGPVVGSNRREHYVTVGRIVPDKRVDLLVDAFRNRREKLIVCGDGGEKERLERESPDNVEFRGYVSEQTKTELVRTAKGFVFAGAREPFGMSIAEALSAGTPVLTVDSGNAPNLIQHGVNGVVTSDNATAITDGVDQLKTIQWNHGEIRRQAEQYSHSAFAERVHEVVSEKEAKVIA